MTCSLRSFLVLLLLAMVGFRLVTVATMASDPLRPQHLSRTVVHPAALRAARTSHARLRVVREMASLPAFMPADARSVHTPSDSTQPSRLALTFPSYWSSLHLTI